VEVVQVKEKSLPSLDEALAKSFGAENLERLRAGVRTDLENELKLKLKRQVRDQLVATLLGRVNCELPEGLVQNETRSVIFDIVRANQERGIPKEAIDGKKDEIYGVASNSARERVKSMLLLNMITLTTLCTKFGADMQADGAGRILNIGSTTSFQPLPYLAAYAATKHYVVAFSEALAEEMSHHGVQVTCVCPGTTQTKFLSSAGVAPSRKFGSVGYWADKAAMSPQDVARVAYEGLRSGERKPIPGFSNLVHFFGSRVLPNRSMAWAMRRLYQVKAD